MEAGTIEHGVDEIIDSVSSTRNEPIFLINPGQLTLESLIDELTPHSQQQVRIVARDELLKDVLDDFIVGSKTADLEANDVFSIKAVAIFDGNSIMATSDRVVAVLETPAGIHGIGSDEPSIVSALIEHCEQEWELAEEFRHRTPARSAVRTTLANDIGESTQRDFDAMLNALGTARGDAGELNEVAISLLVAARNGIQLYDISKWGEDTGVASKATFSRAKTRLEEVGLIETHKVPIELGRPRLKLVLGEEAFETMTIEELANVAIARLET